MSIFYPLEDDGHEKLDEKLDFKGIIIFFIGDFDI